MPTAKRDRRREYDELSEKRRRLIKEGLCRDCEASVDERRFVRCKECRLRNGEQSKKFRCKQPDYMKRYMKKITMECYEAYGGAFCVCCGEANFQFLTIDHINNNGAEERRRTNNASGKCLAWYLRKRGYPVGYQIMCFNCNCGRARNSGVCPHKEKAVGYLSA